MKISRIFKLTPLIIGTCWLTICTTPKASNELPINADGMDSQQLLKILTQITTQEDLVDEKRIGNLLKLHINLTPRPQVEGKDGQLIVSADGRVSPNGYHSGLHDLKYRHATKPISAYGAYLSIGINRNETCIDIKDVNEVFGKLGGMRPIPPPMFAFPPPGTHYAPIAKEQPIYRYRYANQNSSVILEFRYTNCLLNFSITQPKE